MKFTDLLITANTNLFRNKARTFLTIIAIFIGATTLSMTSGIGSGITTYLNQQIGNLGSTSALTISATQANTGPSSTGLKPYNPNEKKISLGFGSSGEALQALTQKDITIIKTIPGIVSVSPTLSVNPNYIATVSHPSKKYQFSIAETYGTTHLDMSAGQPVANSGPALQITIPTSYLSSLNLGNANAALQQAVTISITSATGQQSTVNATIVGVQQANLLGSTSAYASSALFTKLYTLQTVGLPENTRDAYPSVVAIMQSGLTNAQITHLKYVLKQKGYTGLTLKDAVGTIFTVINAVTDIFDAFAFITLLAAGFGIVNTLYMSVQERTKEIGLMKAMGMGKRRIFALFSFEAILIGFWGSVLGVIAANLLGRMINHIVSQGFLKAFPGLNLLTFPISSMARIILGIMVLAFLAGTLPARRASNKDPIDALRYE